MTRPYSKVWDLSKGLETPEPLAYTETMQAIDIAKLKGHLVLCKEAYRDARAERMMLEELGGPVPAELCEREEDLRVTTCDMIKLILNHSETL